MITSRKLALLCIKALTVALILPVMAGCGDRVVVDASTPMVEMDRKSKEVELAVNYCKRVEGDTLTFGTGSTLKSGKIPTYFCWRDHMVIDWWPQEMIKSQLHGIVIEKYSQHDALKIN